MLLDDEHLEDAIKEAAASKNILKLLMHFIYKSGAFRQGLAKDERTENYNRGYGDFGLYIRDLLLQYAPNAYMSEIIEGVKNDRRIEQ
jgi:hypothetical protein